MNRKVEYVNESRVRKHMGGMAFVALTILGFVIAVGALCAFMWFRL
jgi:hypothetical protein